MAPYMEEVRKMEQHFDGLQMEHVPHGSNVVIDELSKTAAARGRVPLGILVERLLRPFVKFPHARGTTSDDSWGEPSTPTLASEAMAAEPCALG